MRVLQISAPLSASKARNDLSLVAPTKYTPLAVSRPPAKLGAPRWRKPGIAQTGNGAWSRIVPSGTRHFTAPVARSTPVSEPQGGGLHGAPKFENSGWRITPYGVPAIGYASAGYTIEPFGSASNSARGTSFV